MRYFLFSLIFHIIIVTVGGITLKKVETIKPKKKPNQSLSIDFGNTQSKKTIVNSNTGKNIKENLKEKETNKTNKIQEINKEEKEKEIKIKEKNVEKKEVVKKKIEKKVEEKEVKIKKTIKEEYKKIEPKKPRESKEVKLEKVKIKEESKLERVKEISENTVEVEKNQENQENSKPNKTTKNRSSKSKITKTKKITNQGENLQEGLSKLEDGTIIAKNQGVKNLEYKFLSQPNPEYPQIAKKMGIKKEIVIKARFLIGLDGKISDIKFYDDVTNYGFREEVIKALKKWESTQIKVGNKPVKLYFYKAFKFKII